MGVEIAEQWRGEMVDGKQKVRKGDCEVGTGWVWVLWRRRWTGRASQ